MRILISTALLFLISLYSFSQTQNNKTKPLTAADSMIQQATVMDYLIIAGTSKDFHALEVSAKDLSKKTGIAYTTFGNIYKDSCIVIPDTSSDELYRGVYVFRRWPSDEISVEMNIEGIMLSPQETKERPKLILVAGVFGDKDEAKKRLAIIKKYIPTAYIKKKQVYIGCIH